MARKKLADPALVLGIDNRPKQANADSLDLYGLHPLCDLNDGEFIERRKNFACGVDPLRNFERQAARNIGLGIGNAEVEGLDTTALADHQHVRVAFRRQKGGLSGGVGENRVDRPRRAVNEGALRP